MYIGRTKGEIVMFMPIISKISTISTKNKLAVL